MSTGEQLITFKRTELETLHGAGPLAFQTYVLLRWWMDYRTGITGRRRPISLAMLEAYCETHTPRGAGLQIEKPTEKSIRGAIARLERAGMLRRLAGPRLAYMLPMAATAPARPIQTGHDTGTHSYTERGTGKTPFKLAYRHIPGLKYETTRRANRAHIKNHVCERVPAWLVDQLRAAGIHLTEADQSIIKLAELADSAERLAKAIERARQLRQRAGSIQALNTGLIRSILEGAPNDMDIRHAEGPSGRQRTNRQPRVDPRTPPRPGETWDAYWLRLDEIRMKGVAPGVAGLSQEEQAEASPQPGGKHAQDSTAVRPQEASNDQPGKASCPTTPP